MSILARTILRRVFERSTAADLARLPAAYRRRGSGLGSRIAAAGLLRLALPWPVLSAALVLAVVVARIAAGRRRPRGIAPALRAPR